jgi:glycosyltransferase involved in cell wall biosynthesis
VATPSRWLMRKVEQSILGPGVVEARIIPHGVDLSVFQPADKKRVRATLGIPQDAEVLLSTAMDIRQSIWKDYSTLRAAIALVAERLHGQDVLFIVLGEDAPIERIGQTEVRFVPYQKHPEAAARYYQAADVYMHAARADTFPNTVLEALACGTPVVATAVGGIPEQIDNSATGYLVPKGDSVAMAERVGTLIENPELRHVMGQRATERAARLFDLERQVQEYLDWYSELVAA